MRGSVRVTPIDPFDNVLDDTLASPGSTWSPCDSFVQACGESSRLGTRELLYGSHLYVSEPNVIHIFDNERTISALRVSFLISFSMASCDSSVRNSMWGHTGTLT